MLRQVSSQLDQHLASMPNLPPVAWPNVSFTPESDVLYLSVMNMPADGVMYTLGRRENTPGVYRINVNAPVNGGPAEAENMAETIAAYFRSNSEIGDGLTIEEINYSPGFVNEAYYTIPLSINWRVFHNASI